MRLVLERLLGDADARPMLQKARERMLESERLTRQVMALHAPVAAVDQAAAALASTAPAADQQPLVDRLRAATLALREAMAGLPTPPARRRR